MTKRAAQQAAKMRMSNTERMLKILSRQITKAVQGGSLTRREADQLRREFWDDRTRDKLLAAGRTTAFAGVDPLDTPQASDYLSRNRLQ